MIKGDIERLQYKLNNLIKSGNSFDEIYRLSIELDKLIVEFYKGKYNLKSFNL